MVEPTPGPAEDETATIIEHRNRKRRYAMLTTYFDLDEDNDYHPSRFERLEYSSWESLSYLIPGFGRPPKPVPVRGGV